MGLLQNKSHNHPAPEHGRDMKGSCRAKPGEIAEHAENSKRRHHVCPPASITTDREIVARPPTRSMLETKIRGR